MSRQLLGYRFGDYELDLPTREIRSPSSVIHLEPRAFDLLVHLLEHRGRLVSKDEITAAVWDVEFVTDNSLSSAVARVRRALQDRRSPRKFVTTVYGYGYRFSAPAEEIYAEGIEEPAVERGRAAAAETSEAVPQQQSASSRRWLWGLAQAVLLVWRRVIQL